MRSARIGGAPDTRRAKKRGGVPWNRHGVRRPDSCGRWPCARLGFCSHVAYLWPCRRRRGEVLRAPTPARSTAVRHEAGFASANPEKIGRAAAAPQEPQERPKWSDGYKKLSNPEPRLCGRRRRFLPGRGEGGDPGRHLLCTQSQLDLVYFRIHRQFWLV